MENIFLAGVCPKCYAYVILDPDTKESEVVPCRDCQTSLIVEHAASRTVSLSQITQPIIPL